MMFMYVLMTVNFVPADYDIGVGYASVYIVYDHARAQHMTLVTSPTPRQCD